MAVRSILDILVASSTISQEQADSIKQESRSSGKSLEKILAEKKVSSDQILEARSTLLGIPTRKLKDKKIPFEVLKYIPEESAKHYEFIPLSYSEGMLEVGMVSPESLESREALQFISSSTNVPFKIYLISQRDFLAVIENYKGLGGEVTQALGEYKTTIEEEGLEDIVSRDRSGTKEVSIDEDAPISKMVNVLIRHAIEGRASDVHIEPGSKDLRARFRVDGILYTSILLPMNVHEAIISRIKIISNLKIDEKRMPQDGRFKRTIDGRQIDFRVSTFPTYFGEKVSIRVLDSGKAISDLESVGLVGRNYDLIKKALKKPYGMILITGPTGSGKSTTLYAMLRLINEEKRNILSLEDPVEYHIEGINQSQVRPEIGYTFASGLRHALRQDPDVIMVGEIRDKETAQLAIHAALTGHLVLSTLHTNNAIGVIPRLIDMGVDPFLIPSTLILAIAQRLTRTLCADSRKEIPLTGKVLESIKKEIDRIPELQKMEVKMPAVIYEAAPSPTCPKGTKGRIGMFEVLSMTAEMEELILKEASEANIGKEAARQGMISIRQDGLLKVLSGKIGLEALSEVAYNE